MRKIGLLLFGGLFIAACSPGLAPNGMTWQEYRAAEYRFKVIYHAEDLAGCSELGPVKGISRDGVAEAKEDAVAKALLLKGNALVFDHLWSDWPLFRLVDRREVYYAEGRAYLCEE